MNTLVAIPNFDSYRFDPKTKDVYSFKRNPLGQKMKYAPSGKNKHFNLTNNQGEQTSISSVKIMKMTSVDLITIYEDTDMYKLDPLTMNVLSYSKIKKGEALNWGFIGSPGDPFVTPFVNNEKRKFKYSEAEALVRKHHQVSPKQETKPTTAELKTKTSAPEYVLFVVHKATQTIKKVKSYSSNPSEEAIRKDCKEYASTDITAEEFVVYKVFKSINREVSFNLI